MELISNTKSHEEKIIYMKDRIKAIPRFKAGFLEYLDTIDFWNSPGSTRFHGNYLGGLIDHVLNLYELCLHLTKQFGYAVADDDIFMYAVIHDLCKPGSYIVTGSSISYNSANHYIGHAKGSLMRIKPYIDLTMQEEQVILYHMGMYGTREFGGARGEYGIKELSNAYNSNKFAKLFYFCDDMVSQFLDVKK